MSAGGSDPDAARRAPPRPPSTHSGGSDRSRRSHQSQPGPHSARGPPSERSHHSGSSGPRSDPASASRPQPPTSAVPGRLGSPRHSNSGSARGGRSPRTPQSAEEVGEGPGPLEEYLLTHRDGSSSSSAPSGLPPPGEELALAVRVLGALGLRDPAYFKVWGALAVSLAWSSGEAETTVVEHTAKPIWNEVLECRIKSDDEVIVTLNDKDWGGLNIEVGTCRVKVRDLVKSSRLEVTLLDLNDDPCGKVVLGIGSKALPLEPAPPTDPVDDPPEDPGPAEDAPPAPKRESAASTDPSPELQRLSVRVGRGRDLGGPAPPLRPSLAFQVGGAEARTGEAPGGGATVWNEEVELLYETVTDSVHVQLKDGRETIARGILTVAELLQTSRGLWVQLEDSTEQACGEVHLSLDAEPSVLSARESLNDLQEPDATVPVRLVRATNVVPYRVEFPRGWIVCALRKDDRREETPPVLLDPNMVWNADFRFPVGSDEPLVVEVRQQTAGELLGRALVPEAVLLCGQREVWVPLQRHHRPSGELCLSVTERPLRYRAPLRPLIEPT